MSKRCGVVILNYKTKYDTIALGKKLSGFDCINDIVVVDNRSGDVFDLDEFKSEKVKIIYNKQNNGYSAGNNLGLKYLVQKKQCEYLFVINPDVIVENDAFEEMIKVLDTVQNISIVSTKRFGANKEVIYQYFQFPKYKESLLSCYALWRKIFFNDNIAKQYELVDSAQGPMYVDAVPGALFGIRSTVLESIGYLNEEIFMYGEEVLLAKQAAELGCFSAITSKATYIHNHRKTPLSENNWKVFMLGKKSTLIFLEKFCNITRLQKSIFEASIAIGVFEYRIGTYLKNMFSKIKFWHRDASFQ